MTKIIIFSSDSNYKFAILRNSKHRFHTI